MNLIRKEKRHRKTSQKLDDANEMIINLKAQVEEIQKKIEDLEEQLTTKVEYYSKLEAEIMRLNLQLEEMSQKISGYHKLEGGSLKLDEMLKSQISPFIKVNLSCEEGKTSKDVNEK